MFLNSLFRTTGFPIILHGSQQQQLPSCSISPNRFPPYRTTSGSPLILYGPTELKTSENVITMNLAKGIYNLGYDPRVVDNHNKEGIEYMPEWLRTRRFIYAPQEAKAAISIGSEVYLPKPSEIYSAVMDYCDTFKCYDPATVEKYNRLYTNIFTISSYSMGVMDSCGVKNLVKVPLGVDTQVFKPLGDKNQLIKLQPPFYVLFTNFSSDIPTDTFVFFAAGMVQHRKAVPEMIKAYARAFDRRDNVILWIHGRLKAWGENKTHIMKSFGPFAPKMVWTDGCISDEMLATVLSRTNIYLSPHRLEGFGLIPLQAMACGTPSIITAFSGPLDYITDLNSYKLPCRVVTAKPSRLIPEGVQWAEWQEDDLVDLMRLTFDHQDECKSQHCIETAQQWTWDRSARVIIDTVENTGLKLARRVRRNRDIVEVLVPIRNGEADIGRFINSIRNVNAGTKFEVIAHNDGSTDNTETLLHKFGVYHTSSPLPEGVPVSRNKLFLLASAKYLFLCDIDLEFMQEGWLSTLLESFRNRSNAGIVHPLLLFKNNLVQSAGGTYAPHDQGVPGWHRFFNYPLDAPGVLESCEILYSPGAACFTSADVVENVGGFSEAYFPTTFDDVDFSYIVKLADYKILYEPRSRIYHHHGSYRGRDFDGLDTFNRNREVFKSMWVNWRKNNV